MLTGTKKRFKYVNTILLIGALAFLGLSSGLVAETPTDKALKWKVDDFRMYLELVLNENILKEVTAKETKNQIIELGNWPHSPLEVKSSITNGNIHIRFEKDFLVIWYHSPVSLVYGKNTPLDVVRQAINNILGEAFVIGELDTLFAQGSGSSVNLKAELVMATWPKEILEMKAVTCTYYSVSHHKRDWKCLVATVNVLVKDRDAIVIMEKAKARQLNVNPFIYEGLIAAKVRLAKDEAEQVKDKPILAKNVIFGPQTDVSNVPDVLLNACMWPIDNEVAVGAKDVGPTSYLRPKPKKPTSTTKPEGT